MNNLFFFLILWNKLNIQLKNTLLEVKNIYKTNKNVQFKGQLILILNI